MCNRGSGVACGRKKAHTSHVGAAAADNEGTAREGHCHNNIRHEQWRYHSQQTPAAHLAQVGVGLPPPARLQVCKLALEVVDCSNRAGRSMTLTPWWCIVPSRSRPGRSTHGQQLHDARCNKQCTAGLPAVCTHPRRGTQSWAAGGRLQGSRPASAVRGKQCKRMSAAGIRGWRKWPGPLHHVAPRSTPHSSCHTAKANAAAATACTAGTAACTAAGGTCGWYSRISR